MTWEEGTWAAWDARMIVPQMLPDSPETVEKSAAPKARTRPTIATRKRTQTSESPKRSARGEELVAVGILLVQDMVNLSFGEVTLELDSSF